MALELRDTLCPLSVVYLSIYVILTKLLTQGPPIPLYEPKSDGRADNIFISKSYDATSHFETTTDDVKDIYRRATGEELIFEGLREGVQMSEDS